MGRKKKLRALSPDFIRKEKSRYIRLYPKTIRFNKVEMEYIDDYCDKFGIKSKASFYRECIMRTVMKENDRNYPSLF